MCTRASARASRGFSTSFKDPAANRTSFGDYRRLCAKWQHTTVSSFRLALGSKNYVQTRNALFILSHIVKVGYLQPKCVLSYLLPAFAAPKLCAESSSMHADMLVHVAKAPFLHFFWHTVKAISPSHLSFTLLSPGAYVSAGQTKVSHSMFVPAPVLLDWGIHADPPCH